MFGFGDIYLLRPNTLILIFEPGLLTVSVNLGFYCPLFCLPFESDLDFLEHPITLFHLQNGGF